MTDLTLYNLMAEDMIIWARLVDNKQVQVTVQAREYEGTLFCEKSHLAAWESLVYFAKQVIKCDDRIQKELETQ